ncbi:hypothetical protein WJX81_001270 [Elliptochloris bilobata]|uniref:Enoyl reductase (ER) domain-containing protein n=1 Tax=Elliptochloris bilobata TaxID=381761 RepID=A0AAW1S8M3_9CHLO
MRAITVEAPGQPSVLKIGTVPAPKLAAQEIRLKVKSAGVNRADCMQREGKYPPPPGASTIIGLECCGTVQEIGADVPADSFRVGQRVMALLSGGGYAEEVCVDAGWVLPAPESMSDEEAGGLMEATLTAYLNIFEVAGAQAGQLVLIHGGGSGVGTAAIALCKAKGVKTLVTAGSDGKVQQCLEHGATWAFNYKTEDWAGRVKQAAEPSGVHIVLDCVGAPYLQMNLECLAPEGCIVYIAAQGGAIVKELDLWVLMRKRIRLIGSTLRSRSAAFKTALVRKFGEDFRAELARGDIRPVVDKVYKLESAELAHMHMESGRNFGKIVLTAAPL